MDKEFGDLKMGTPEQGELFDQARGGLLAVMAVLNVRINELDEDALESEQLLAEEQKYARRLNRLHPTDPGLPQLVDELPALLRQARGETLGRTA